ncbi:MAG: hypothetical protein ABFS24_02520 [Pseudomonadota bacterium]
MKIKTTKQALLTCLSLALAIIFTTAAEARPSDKWRLHFNGKANNDGVLVIELIPVGGQPITIQAEIRNNTRENEAAREVTRKLRGVLKDDYNIRHDDGEEIKIKAEGGRADFELEVISNTADGLKVRTDHE